MELFIDKRGKDKGFTGILTLRGYLKKALYDIIICPHRSNKHLTG